MALLPLLLGGASVVGKLFGGAAKGASDERTQRNNFTNDAAGRETQQYGIEQSARSQLAQLLEQASMNRAQMGVQAPSARTKQAILGSLLQHMKPVSVTPPKGVRMGQVSGGLNVSALSPLAGGGELERQALMALLTKSDVPSMPDTSGTIVGRPGAPTYAQPGKLESVLSGGSLLAALLGGVGSMLPDKKAPAAGGGGTSFSAPYRGVRF
jgi:hypothetical protein